MDTRNAARVFGAAGFFNVVIVLPLMLWAWRRGEVGLPAVSAGFGDFVFALLFVDVLRRMAPRRSEADG